MVALYTRRIKTDPQDAYAYFDRARYYDYLHERLKAQVDMRRWAAVVSGRSPSGVWFGTPRDLGWIIDLPFNCELVFSAERPVHTIPTMSIAFGRKGRCERKLFEIPMVVASLVGLGFLASLDAPQTRADFTFGEPVDLESDFPLLNPPAEHPDCFSADGLEMYFGSRRSGGQGGYDLWVCKRASPEDDWGPPDNLGPVVNSASADLFISISGDGLELYFASTRPGGYGSNDLYVTKRATRNSPWGPPTNLGPNVNASSINFTPSVSSDALELFFSSNRPGGYGANDLWVSRRATRNDPWGDPVNLGPAVNGPSYQQAPCLSSDGLLLFFHSDRPGGYGSVDLWMTRRASRSAPWEPAVNLGPKINTPNWECRPCLVPDSSALYFVRADTSGNPLASWKAPILPIRESGGRAGERKGGPEMTTRRPHIDSS